MLQIFIITIFIIHAVLGALPLIYKLYTVLTPTSWHSTKMRLYWNCESDQRYLLPVMFLTCEYLPNQNVYGITIQFGYKWAAIEYRVNLPKTTAQIESKIKALYARRTDLHASLEFTDSPTDVLDINRQLEACTKEITYLRKQI